ncbi:hypothetical protein [Cohnella caldifontis]|uniref:hypothetical protein n=1 Tax=Cohnella caldifontis TaxID=3027471 RepID=UPI0023ED3319|nr:hypothetical protein [Cohnella sp. YIM B05605]
MKGQGKRISLGLSILALCALAVYQTYSIVRLKDQIEMVNPTVSRSIQHGLVQLEMEISYQQQHHWDSAGQIIHDIQDVMDAIGITYEAAQYTGTLTESDRASLWELHQYLYAFAENKATHDLTLNEDDRKSFERLRAKLRENGWGANIGFSSDWNDFMRRVRNLLSRSE